MYNQKIKTEAFQLPKPKRKKCNSGIYVKVDSYNRSIPPSIVSTDFVYVKLPNEEGNSTPAKQTRKLSTASLF